MEYVYAYLANYCHQAHKVNHFDMGSPNYLKQVRRPYSSTLLDYHSCRLPVLAIR